MTITLRWKIAILNMVHTKPVGLDYTRFKKHPSIEMNELIKRYKIT